MRNLVSRLFNYRLRALIKKSSPDRPRPRLQISLILPPSCNDALRFALSANVTDVRLAVEDDSRSPESAS